MRDPSRAVPIRATVAALACSWLAVALGRTAADLIVSAGPAVTSLDRPIAAVVVGIGAAAAGTLAAGCWLLAVANLARRLDRPADWCDRAGTRLTPVLLRRAVGLTVGAGLGVAALGGIASAEEPDLGWEVTTTATHAGDTDAIPMVDPAQDATLSTPDPSSEALTAQPPIAVPTPTVGPALEEIAAPLSTPAAQPATPGAVVTSVTVRPGDSLWRITAAHLPADASDAEIAAAWPRWYEANRAVIGADPGLIYPGQVLQTPTGAPVGTP